MKILGFLILALNSFGIGCRFFRDVCEIQDLLELGGDKLEVTWNVLTRTLYQVLYLAQDFAMGAA